MLAYSTSLQCLQFHSLHSMQWKFSFCLSRLPLQGTWRCRKSPFPQIPQQWVTAWLASRAWNHLCDFPGRDCFSLHPSKLAVICAVRMLEILTGKHKQVIISCNSRSREVHLDLSPQPKVNNCWAANQLLERLISPVWHAIIARRKEVMPWIDGLGVWPWLKYYIPLSNVKLRGSIWSSHGQFHVTLSDKGLLFHMIKGHSKTCTSNAPNLGDTGTLTCPLEPLNNQPAWSLPEVPAI